MLGSDFPFPLGEHHPGKLIASSSYDDKTKVMLLPKGYPPVIRPLQAQMLSENAIEFFGLRKEQFL